MHDFVQSVAARLPDEVRRGRLLAAVSGGADSVALVRALAGLKSEWKLELHGAYLDHALRGGAGQRDEEWLRRLFDSLSIPAHFGNAPVSDFAEKEGLSIEEAARIARYDFLVETARRIGVPWIAVAHTADDQAETILHHILRGTGVAGLRGMPAVRLLEAGESGSQPVTLVRPMLSITRCDVEAYLRDVGQDFLHDETNDDSAFTRNRIRRELLPRLRSDFHREVDASLLRLGRQAAELTDVIDALTAKLLAECVLDATETVCRLDRATLREQPRYLVRECLRAVWKKRSWPQKRMGFDHWERLAGLVFDEGTTTLPGEIRAESRGNLLMLSRESGRA